MTPPRTIPFDYPAPGAAAAAMAGEGLPWLDALRDEGRRLSANGLPSTRSEAWKYTNLAPLAELDFSAPSMAAEVPSTDLDPGAFDGLEGPSLVFVNGRLSGRHSRLDGLPGGLRVRGLAQGLADDPAEIEALIGDATPNGDPLAAFNAAFGADGCIVETAPGTAVEEPVRLRFVAAPGSEPLAYHPRVIVRLGARSRLSLDRVSRGAGGCADVVQSARRHSDRRGRQAQPRQAADRGRGRLSHCADQGVADRRGPLREPPAGLGRTARAPRNPRSLRR